MVRRATAVRLLVLAVMMMPITRAYAQTGAIPPMDSASTSTPVTETRPATTTFFGDTGLWFVPTAEVLAGGKLSASGYRRCVR